MRVESQQRLVSQQRVVSQQHVVSLQRIIQVNYRGSHFSGLQRSPLKFLE